MTDEQPCCAVGRDGERPSRDEDAQVNESSDARFSTEPADSDDERVARMVRLGGGTFIMGTDSDVGFPQDGEGPAREVTVDSFYIDKHAVTNAESLQFIRDTEYTTDAERFGWSFVFEDFLHDVDRDKSCRMWPRHPVGGRRGR
jgi:sulfatase modifying factor 1